MKIGKLNKKILVIFFLIVLLVSFIFLRNKNSKSGYIFEKAEIADLTEVVSESGNFTSDGNIPIYSPTNGRVSEIFVDNGNRIKKGNDLFTVVSSATEAEKHAAYANYLTAKSVLDADTADFNSLQSTMFAVWKIYKDMVSDSKYVYSDGKPNMVNRTLPEFIIAQDNWLSAEADYKNQQGIIAKDQAALANAYFNYLATQTTTIKAPIDGIIDNISTSTGNSVSARTILTPSPKPILIIKNSNVLEAVIPVGQTNITKINIGQQVIIKPDAYKDKTYQGKVIRIDNLGENIQGVVTYNVYVQTDSDKYLKPGMTFDSDIIIQNLKNVLTVPNSSIIVNKGIKTVRIFERGEIRYLPVKIGIKGQTKTQIIDGVSDGQEIITALTNEKAPKPSLLGL